MRHIATSVIAVEKLKQAAKKAKRKYKISHSDALDRVARGEGYAHWHHVTLCARETARLSSQATLLDECQYIADAAVAGRAVCVVTGPEILTDGPMVLFSTTDGDAWLLEPNERLCTCLAWHGDKRDPGVIDRDQRLLINWGGVYELRGNFFCVDMDDGTIGQRMIGGYPIEPLRKAINKSLSFDATMNDIFEGRGDMNLSDDVIADLVRQGWDEKELSEARNSGAIYSSARNSLLYPAFDSPDEI